MLCADDGHVHIFGSADTADGAATAVAGVHSARILEYQEQGKTINEIAFGWKHALVLGTAVS